jgi:TonB family protein
VQGAVVLKLTVGKDGRVIKAAAISGEEELADSAVHAARKWLYVPYFRDAKPIEAQTIVTINFKVTESGKPDITATYKVPPSPPVGSIFTAGNGVMPPTAIYQPDPEYSDEALKAKYGGTCVLSLIVGPDGRPYDINVTRAIGKGLDEKAIEAVQQWRFKPATKGGQPVSAAINVEIQFRL